MTNETTYTVTISDASGEEVIHDCSALDVRTLKALYADAPHIMTVITTEEWQAIS